MWQIREQPVFVAGIQGHGQRRYLDRQVGMVPPTIMGGNEGVE